MTPKENKNYEYIKENEPINEHINAILSEYEKRIEKLEEDVKSLEKIIY